MREILFRGKRKGCGDWVYGFLTMREFKALAIFVPNQKERIEYAEPFGTTYCVYPETVGQFTGLTDMNGKNIFEGDVLKFHRNFMSYVIGKVIFECGTFAFEYEDAAHGIDLEWFSFSDDSVALPEHCMELIGNIHDNPELLKGA